MTIPVISEYPRRLMFKACRHLYLITLLSLSTHASAEDEFEAYKQSAEQEYRAVSAEFEQYKKDLMEAFESYRTKTAAVWGQQQRMPSSTTWVSYLGDLKHRGVVDFAKGQVNVEFVLDSEQMLDDQEIQSRLKKQAMQLYQQGVDQRTMQALARDPVAQSAGPAILQGLVEDVPQLSLSIDEVMVVESQQIVGEDGERRTIYRTWFELLPDHIHRRAIKYEQDILFQSEKYKVSSAMVFAIMETESMFNPTARSPVPAFGLMQLVPSSGAREAYKYVYESDIVVTDEYLYDPKNNIELGAAYLNRLYYRYFRAIKNPESRQWASIAAYNTGMGNVIRAFAGKYSSQRFTSRRAWRKSAYHEINKMNGEQVYQFLRGHLPYKETRSYIKKVRERMDKYKS